MASSYVACGQGHHTSDIQRGDITMADDNFTEQENEKLQTYQQERDLQRRGVKVDDAIKGITDDDRKMMINRSLRKVGSRLNVS
jgi:hypothetical protein